MNNKRKLTRPAKQTSRTANVKSQPRPKMNNIVPPTPISTKDVSHSVQPLYLKI